jgi:hypothetical protein
MNELPRLQEKLSALSAAHPAFPQILAELSLKEGQFLSWLWTQTPQGASVPGTPGSAELADVIGQLQLNPVDELPRTLHNLERLRLIAVSTSPDTPDLQLKPGNVHITIFGIEFLKACGTTVATRDIEAT